MFLLRGSVAALSKQAAANTLVPHLIEQFRFQLGYAPPRSEMVSWERPGVAGASAAPLVPGMACSKSQRRASRRQGG